MRIRTPEGTQSFLLTPDRVQELWKIFSSIPGILDDYGKGNYEAFIAKLTDNDSLWFECTDFPGVLYANGIRVGLSAHVHFAFFDKKLRGREEFLLNALKWLVNTLQLEKVNAFVPGFCLAIHRFLKNIGFKIEGEIRNWSRENGRLFNVIVFGMTKEEVMNGGVFSATNVRAASDETESMDEQQLFHEYNVRTEPSEGGLSGGTSNTASDQSNATEYQSIRPGDGGVLLESTPNGGDAEHK